MLDRHPEMVTLIEEVLEIVRRPDAITPDPIKGRWRYWRADIGPTRWIRVVVDWHAPQPAIWTAFPDGGNPL